MPISSFPPELLCLRQTETWTWDLNTSLLLLGSSSNTRWVNWASCVCSGTHVLESKAESNRYIRYFVQKRYTGRHSQMPYHQHSKGKPNDLHEPFFIRKQICFPLLGTHWSKKGKLQPVMLASPLVQRLTWWHFGGFGNSCGALHWCGGSLLPGSRSVLIKPAKLCKPSCQALINCLVWSSQQRDCLSTVRLQSVNDEQSARLHSECAQLRRFACSVNRFLIFLSEFVSGIQTSEGQSLQIPLQFLLFISVWA